MVRQRTASCTFPFPSLCHARFMADWGSNLSAHYHSSIAAVWIKDMDIIMRMNCKLTSMNHRYISLPAFDLSNFSFSKERLSWDFFILRFQQWNGQYLSHMRCTCWRHQSSREVIYKVSYNWTDPFVVELNLYSKGIEEAVWCNGHTAIPALWVGNALLCFQAVSLWEKVPLCY